MRRRRRNPSGVIGWASAHPWLTVLFVIPALVGFPIALVKAIKGKQLAGTGATPATNPPTVTSATWGSSRQGDGYVDLQLISPHGDFFSQTQPVSNVLARFPDGSINVKVSAGFPDDGFNLTDGQVLHAMHPAGTA